MVECLKAHRRISTKEARAIALDKLRQVQIPSPEKRLDQYPHELSGGMRQRIIIAIALLLDPDIIIADEPTTALDVTIQAEIMALLLELCEQHNVGLILITHDLGGGKPSDPAYAGDVRWPRHRAGPYAGNHQRPATSLHPRLDQCAAANGDAG